MKNYSELKNFAARKLAAIYETSDYARIHIHLGSVESSFRSVSADKFGLEYLAACLALASISWGKCCRENDLAGKENENIFFKMLMDSFAAPKFINVASAFSVYLHSPEASEKSVLAVAGTFFQRLELKRLIESESGVGRMHEAFRLLVEAWEGFRSSFENDFFEFIHS